jgi:hypothetical protein
LAKPSSVGGVRGQAIVEVSRENIFAGDVVTPLSSSTTRSVLNNQQMQNHSASVVASSEVKPNEADCIRMPCLGELRVEPVGPPVRDFGGDQRLTTNDRFAND